MSNNIFLDYAIMLVSDISSDSDITITVSYVSNDTIRFYGRGVLELSCEDSDQVYFYYFATPNMKNIYYCNVVDLKDPNSLDALLPWMRITAGLEALENIKWNYVT